MNIPCHDKCLYNDYDALFWSIGGRSREQFKEDREKKIQQKRIEKKQRMKDLFNSEYDDKDGQSKDGTYFDSLKAEMEQQAEVRKWLNG